MMKWSLSDNELSVIIGACKLAFPLVDGSVTGLGAVTVNGRQLRSVHPPLRPWIQSVDGVYYEHFTIDTVEQIDDALLIHTTAHGRPQNESPFGDQYNDRLFVVSENAKPVEDKLTWILRPEKVNLDDLEYVGFSYAWQFTSRTQKIHRLISHGTWEIDGKATGNTILSQGQVTPAVYPADKTTHFTSACLQSLQRFGDPTAMSFQFSPRWGVHQCFDFLAHDKGTLLGFWPEKNDTRSFLQKNPGENVIFMVDAMHWKATGSVTTPKKCIVFCAADMLPENEARNRWFSANEFCTGIVRGLFNIKRSRPLPERTIGYGQRLLEDGTFEMRVLEEWLPAQEWLPALADKMLPILRKQGTRRVITEPIVESDPTQRGHLCKLGASGLHGDLNVGSVCCVHRYRPAELFGGMDAWRYYCKKAHELGLEVGHWVGPHLAYNAPILDEHPEWYSRAFTTLVASGGYPNFELACLNWNTPVRQWIFDDLQRMKEEAGLDYIWFDSLGNLGMLPVDFSRHMETNTEALLEFMADLQSIGIGSIAVEGMSAAAMSGAHIMDHAPNHDGGVQWIAGQNSWLWYEGNEDMLVGQQPRTWVHQSRPEEDARKRLFRCLANRCVPELRRYGAKEWFKSQIETYLTVEEHMVKRHLLPDKQGVTWTGNDATVLFAFKDLDYPVPAGAKVERIEAGHLSPVEHEDILRAEAFAVYRVH